MAADDVTGQSGASRLKRAGLAAAMAVVGLNVWTGSPLLALWVGSRVQGDGPPKMSAVAVVVIVLGACSFLLYQLMKRIGHAYNAAAGHVPSVRTHAPWLRSMRGERESYGDGRAQVTATERIVVLTVIVAVVAFEIWFFFFAGSPLPRG